VIDNRKDIMKRSYEIIVNPASRSGKGLLIWQEIEPLLKKEHVTYQLHFSKKSGDCKELAGRLSEQYNGKICNLIVLGGDGTLNEVLQGITNPESFTIGYLPTGSSNDFARAMHIPSVPKEALSLILNSKSPKVLDIGVVSCNDFTRSFAVSCGIGFDAAVCKEALHSKSKKFLNKIGLGKLTYLTIALKQLITAGKVSCELQLEDGKVVRLKRVLFLAAMVHPYEGGGFMFCPGADCTDGYLDVCVAGNIPKLKALFMLPSAFKGEHYKFKGIHRFLVKEMTVRLSEPLWIHTDGEVSHKSDTLHVHCETKKMSVFVPETTL